MKKMIDLFFRIIRNVALLYYFKKVYLPAGIVAYELKREIKVPFLYTFCFLSNRGLKSIAISQQQLYFLLEKVDESFKNEVSEALIFSEKEEPCVVKLCWQEDSWSVSASKVAPLSSDWQPEKVFLTTAE